MDLSTPIENVPAQGLSQRNDVPMENTENIPIPTIGGHTLSPVTNDVKRAKYDETIDMETPSTSSHDDAIISKTESNQMEVEEEPEIIEVNSSLKIFDWIATNKTQN